MECWNDGTMGDEKEWIDQMMGAQVLGLRVYPLSQNSIISIAERSEVDLGILRRN